MMLGKTENKNVMGLFVFLKVAVNSRRYQGKLAYQQVERNTTQLSKFVLTK
jgi:hypothetical protein